MRAALDREGGARDPGCCDDRRTAAADESGGHDELPVESVRVEELEGGRNGQFANARSSSKAIPREARHAVPPGLARATCGCAASKLQTARLVEGQSASRLDSWCGQLTERGPTSGRVAFQLTSTSRNSARSR